MTNDERRYLRIAWIFLAIVVGALIVIWTWRIVSPGEPAGEMPAIPEAQKTWEPAFLQWIGKPAPDFSANDLNGTRQSIEKYKGKRIMLVFWATWCGPCTEEIPSLIQLRKDIPQDKLEIIAITFENPALVQTFVKQHEINYTVIASDQQTFPAPFNEIDSIPCSFFIDKNGVIRMATVGLVGSKDLRQILNSMHDIN